MLASILAPFLPDGDQKLGGSPGVGLAPKEEKLSTNITDVNASRWETSAWRLLLR
jgi:hypothetical protein